MLLTRRFSISAKVVTYYYTVISLVYTGDGYIFRKLLSFVLEAFYYATVYTNDRESGVNLYIYEKKRLRLINN